MKHGLITLFVLPDDAASREAERIVFGQLPKDAVTILVCPQFMADDYTIPYIANEDLSPFYGLEGIRHYLSHREQRSSVWAEA